MTRSNSRGFGLVEALMSMFLVGVILGIVGRGYSAMNRMNLATYQMSQRMELSAFLQRLSNEVSSALSVSTVPSGFTFQRIDPTLNLTRNEPVGRIPFPLPDPLPTTANPMSATYQVAVTYRLNAATFSMERTAFSQTTVEAVNVGEFLAQIEPGGRILSVEMRPKEMTSAAKARIFMPVVTP